MAKTTATATVNFTSVEKLRTLRIAWLHRKVMVEDFRTQYAFFNGSEIYCISLARHCRTRPAELIISCGQHFLACNCNTCICCCANCSYSYTAVQLLYILMYAQSSSIATVVRPGTVCIIKLH